MTMFGSCGHDISKEWDAWFDSWYVDEHSSPPKPDPLSLDLAIMEFSRTGENAVSYGVYCKKCRAKYERWGLVLHNEQEEEDWMDGKTEYPE